MATLKQRLHRKNSAGTYDTIHYETSSDVVMRPSGRSVEQDLAAYLPEVQNNDNVPESLKSNKLVVGTTKAFTLGKEISFSGHTHTISQVTSLQSEIDSLKTSVSSGKATIASAVTDKGVQTAADATFQQIADNINAIQTGSTSGVLYIDDFTGYGATINVPWYSGQKRLRLLARSSSQGWSSNTIIYTKTNYILNINSTLYHISDGGSEIPDTLSYIFSSITWLTDSVQLVLKASKGLSVGSILFTY